MSKCGHDSGFTYAGCLKCDFDRLQAKLDAYERQWNDLLAVSRQADKLNREMYPQFREQK